jgi:hypothetical protein
LACAAAFRWQGPRWGPARPVDYCPSDNRPLSADHTGFPDPTPRAPDSDEDQAMSDRFRSTLVSVLGVQAVTLVLLWLLQQHYSR